MSQSKLTKALKDRNEEGVYTQVAAAIEAFDKSFRSKFERLLTDVMAASGAASAKMLKQQLTVKASRVHALGFRVAAPKIKGWAFDVTDPRAKKWVEDHATEAIDDMDATTRESITELVQQAFDGAFDVHDLADEIASLIGDDARAETIARTETMTASNRGQQEAWDQAVDDGLLTGNEKQVWIVTPDDRLCPICEPLEGQETDLDGTFNVDGDQIDGPPAHPRCRCTVALNV